jgi:hypothetical protein
MTEQRYSLVNIFHDADIGFAELQASSVRRFLPRELVDEIIVIANAGNKSSELLSRLRNAYRSDERSVLYLRSEDILHSEELLKPGWWSQQALKLKASHLVGNERYIILDAKNHFIAPVMRSKIEAEGLPRLFWHSYAIHPMRGWAERALAFFGLPPESQVTHLPQSLTPFVAYTKIARGTLNRIKELDNRPTTVVFRDRRISEFLSYGAYLLASGEQSHRLYRFDQPRSVSIWDSDIPKLRELMPDAALTFALHKSALPKLIESELVTIATFWLRLGLVETLSAGLELLNETIVHHKSKGQL